MPQGQDNSQSEMPSVVASTASLPVDLTELRARTLRTQDPCPHPKR